MALTSRSLFLYGFEINSNNFSVDFKSISGGPTLMASLNFGFYSLSDLLVELGRAMNAADPSNTYTWTADRTISGGTQNRVTVTTSSSFLSLLFGTGPRTATSVAPLIGFNTSDYTGNTTYTGSSSAGTTLTTALNGYNYLGPDFIRQVFGSVNISTSGRKEAIVWNVQKFIEVEFRYETQANVITSWQPLFSWMIQQKPFDFTPNVTSPNTFYNVTLETTAADGKGLGYKFTEMLPDFPFFYKTGLIRMRQKG